MNPGELIVPFNRPTLVGTELEYLRQAVDRRQLAGEGHFVRQCEALLQETLRVPRCLLTGSGTQALEMTALLLNIGPGDEVILPSFTFVATATPFVMRGARPVFADIRPDTFNLDVARLESLITPATRAVVAVHYAGVACEMEPLLALAARHRFAVIEDNALGVFGKYRGRMLGSFGRLATLSFHETKALTSGEGGALLINDPDLTARAAIAHDNGTDRQEFLAGKVKEYTWRDLGSNYSLANLNAAFLWAQLENRERVFHQLRRIWSIYNEELADWAAREGMRLPVIPEGCEPIPSGFTLLAPDAANRTRFISHLRECGVQAVFHYQPLHRSLMGERLGGAGVSCPVTEAVAARLVRLPFYQDLTADQQALVIAAVKKYSCSPR